ncbi:pentapeptide repeat-containing protein [Pseudooceanicola marinus]|uniref:pentapeptide repeat-containing protein n=1 Tax=Pseudooceanicola marinus TaxID=396013 RepID=UPI001CD38ADA|nr:pentapeptide repeat-containing protein [Pseudooceanicola marinus]MCA1334833.1 pentapeptide repeat-containing protein [Pseudooceanicola marinus]
MDSYLQVVTHPFLWIAAGFTVLIFLIQGVNSTKDGTQRKANRTSPINHLRRHYVSFLTAAALTLFAGALWFYLFEVGLSIHDLVDLLRERAALERADYTDAETGQITFASYEDLRNIGYTAAVLIGVLAATATLIFSLIRVWTNERTTRATEEGLITDRINKAVEGLGAEKKVDKIGRPVVIVKADDTQEALIEWENTGLELPALAKIHEKARWQVFSRSEPNLEVRIGAILSLERIAQDSARDHIQIMEILCAYIRENIGNRPILPLPEDRTPQSWRAWGKPGLAAVPRLDIDMALKVIERRGAGRKAAEAAQEPAFQLGLERLAGTGLDLRGRALEKAVLRGAELQGADLGFAQLQGADLRRAKLQGAHLGDAELKGADLRDAELQGAHLGGAKLQGAHLGAAKLQGADLGGAKLQGANLWDAELQGANLMGAEFDAATDLSSATLRGALLRFVDFTNVPQIDAHLDPDQVFFDGSITLPGVITSDMPKWPYEDRRDVLEFGDLNRAWRAWQREHHPDTLPDHLR